MISTLSLVWIEMWLYLTENKEYVAGSTRLFMKKNPEIAINPFFFHSKFQYSH